MRRPASIVPSWAATLPVAALLAAALLPAGLARPARAADPAADGKPAEGGAPAVEVVVQRAGKECFASLVHAFGYLRPRTAAVVMFNAPNFKIADVKVKVGDTVRRGDVVATATPPAAASQATPQGTPQGGAPPEVAIRSLAAGTVLQSTAFKGQLLSQKSEPLFTLAVDGEIEAALSIPSIHVGELGGGQAVHLTTRDGTSYNGHVRLMPATVDPQSQMGEVRVSIDGDARPAPGRFLRATVEASRSCNIGVPRAALRRTSAGMQVEIVDGGIVITRAVRVGLSNETDAEVVAGLGVGDLVVANAGSSLRSGDRVKPIFADLQDAR